MFGMRGIHHLALATRDMAGTIRFWRDLLGMRMVAGQGNQGYKLYLFEICAHNYIVFFEWPEVQPLPEKDHGHPVAGPFAFDHVSFAVENDAGLWALRDRIDAAGFWVSDMMDHGFIHSIYCFDPNGIPIEFSSRVEGVDIGSDPVLVDSSPGPEALEGPEPILNMWPPVLRPTPVNERDIFPGEGMELVTGEKKNRWDGVPRSAKKSG